MTTDPHELLDLILTATNDGVVDWDLATGEVTYSDRWKMQLGYDPRQLVDSEALWRELSHPEDLAEADEQLRNHLEEFWPLCHTWRMRHSNGEWRWLMCRGVLVMGAEPRPVRCLRVFTDITDQMRLVRRMETLLESVREGVCAVGQDQRITFVNEHAARMLGRTGAEVIGKRLALSLPHRAHGDAACAPGTCPLLAPLGGGPETVSGCDVLLAKDGSAIPVDYVSAAAREEGRIIGLVLTFRARAPEDPAGPEGGPA